MDVTWNTLLFCVLFLTPALLGLSIFKLFFPTHRVASFFRSNFILFVFAVAATFAINGGLLIESTAWFLKTTGFNPPILKFAAHTLEAADCYWRPSLAIFNYCSRPDPQAGRSPIGLIVDLHIRTLVVTIFPCLFLAAASWIAAALEDFRLEEVCSIYVKKGKTIRTEVPLWIVRRILWIVGNLFHYIYHRPVRYLRNTIYHPWSVLTEANRQSEIVMADVLTKNAMYSGMILGWHANPSDGAESIILGYIMRTERFLDEKGNTKNLKKRFIRNDGKLLIPMNEIQNIYLWKIMKKFPIWCEVASEEDFEEVKRWMALAHANKVRKVIAKIATLPEGKLHAAAQALKEWAEGDSVPFEIFGYVKKVHLGSDNQSKPFVKTR